MLVLVQWAQSQPGDWVEIDSEKWHTLALKAHGSKVDNAPGLIAAINVQGVIFAGFDHCHVEPIAGRGCRVTTWRDDDSDPVAWEFLPLAPDPAVGGRYNTHQRRVVYCDHAERRALYLDTEKTEVRTRGEWKAPKGASVRHGGVTDEKHRSAVSSRGWREWTEGVPIERVRDGRVRG